MNPPSPTQGYFQRFWALDVVWPGLGDIAASHMVEDAALADRQRGPVHNRAACSPHPSLLLNVCRLAVARDPQLNTRPSKTASSEERTESPKKSLQRVAQTKYGERESNRNQALPHRPHDTLQPTRAYSPLSPYSSWYVILRISPRR